MRQFPDSLRMHSRHRFSLDNQVDQGFLPGAELRIGWPVLREINNGHSRRDFVWICHMKVHFSKFHMLFPMTNKEAPTVARKIHHWVAVLGVFEVLQSDNGSELKGACLELMRRYGIKVINGRPRTPRTRGLIEQANASVKNKINSWKRDHGSSHWVDALKVRYSIFFSFFSIFSASSSYPQSSINISLIGRVFYVPRIQKGVCHIKFMIGEN